MVTVLLLSAVHPPPPIWRESTWSLLLEALVPPVLWGRLSAFSLCIGTTGPLSLSFLIMYLVFCLLFPRSSCSFSQLRMKRFSQFLS